MGIYDNRFQRKVHHTYYVWVPVTLGLCAVLFYLPKLAGNHLEGGIIATICEEIDQKRKTMRLMTSDQYKMKQRIQHIIRLYHKGD